MQISSSYPRHWMLLFGLVFFSFQQVRKGVISYEKDAGFIPSLAVNAIMVSSSNTLDLPKIQDGDPATFWQSEAPLPTGFINRKDLNFFYKKASTFFDFSDGQKACDGDLNTAVFIKKNGQAATLKINFPTAENLHSISAKLQMETEVRAFVVLKNGKKKDIGIFGLSNNYQLQRIDIEGVVSGLELVSEKGFGVFEIAALTGLPKEFVVFDFHEKIKLGKLILKNWSGGQAIHATKILVSNDQQNWEEIRSFRGEFSFPYAVNFPEEKEARYLKLEVEMTDKEWQKTSIFELKIYNKNGEYGPMPIARKSPATLQEMMGVNGYWSWGHNTFSSMLKPGEGPALYKPVSSHGRNYHDLTWDLTSPDQPIDFSKMKTAGTPANNWLDWDREYKAWADAGLDIQTTIQFYRFKDSEWKTPYQSAYNYGQAYAKHFGAKQGNGLVCTIEIGNEPWAYNAETYRAILQGMAKGAKTADTHIEVFPCTLQAADPDAETHGLFKNYMGARIPKSAIPYLDGINIHAYSYILDDAGQRKSTYPEHQNSTFWEVLNAIKWRDKNMPGKKIYLTEWGYDGEGGGEDCTHSECVSEAAVANYSLRTLLISARLGLHRATWYFYANSEENSSLYTRSGLTSSKRFGFKKKEVYNVLENLVKKYGDLYFSEVLQENSEGWVYAFSSADQQRKFIIAWRPVDYQQRRLSSKYILAKGVKIKSAEFLQQPDYIFDKKQLVLEVNGQKSLQYSAIPVIFEIENW